MDERTLARAMGAGGYRGSPVEREDRAEGLKEGARVRWLVWPADLVGTVTEIEIDEDGDPWFHLTFSEADDHKDVRVERDAIAPMKS